MELIETFLSLAIVKVVTIPIFLFVFKSAWDFTNKRKERLRADYNFAEKFLTDDCWKDMSDYSLQRAYEALSGIRVKGSIVRFFLSRRNALEDLFNYAIGKSFLIANEREGNFVGIKLKRRFAWKWLWTWFTYFLSAFIVLSPLIFFKTLFELKLSGYYILLIAVVVLYSMMLTYFRIKKIIALDAAKQVYNTFEMTPQKEDILNFLKSKKDEMVQHFDVTKLGLFGSYALNKQTEDSDIDLLIEFAPNTDALAEKKEAIRQAVQSAFGKKVDLCREKYIKPYFREQILKSIIYV